jgi:hypothetical protein
MIPTSVHFSDSVIDTQSDLNQTKANVSSLSQSTSNQNLSSNIQPRSELDSHANMIVLGKFSFIFESTGQTCSVIPFSKDLGVAENVPVVDGAIAYDDPFTGQVYILICRNALYIPSMDNNLLPPFILRAGGVRLNDVPKIHCTNPRNIDHSISFENHDLIIPLQLHGTFSFFNHRLPTNDELYGCDKIFITPDSSKWNPHCDSFARNEQSMTDYEGNIVSSSRQSHYIMETPTTDDFGYNLSSLTSSLWNLRIDTCMHSSFTHGNISSIFATASDDDVIEFAENLSSQVEISKFKSSIGCCTILPDDGELFLDYAPVDTEDSFINFTKDINISSTSALPSKGVNHKVLAKLWCINDKQAKAVIDSSTQLNRQSADNTLSRNFSTNDRMLRYRRINSVFFTDTMFVTKQAKSLRGYIACQVFVSDKGFIAVYPMFKASNFEDALHLFCKEIGVPLTLVADPHPSQKSNSVRRFCDQVGTTLRLLEKSTQWANRAELYIGLLKEAVRKDLRASHSPMVLWDYCIQRRARIHNVTPRNLFQNETLNPYTITFGQIADISSFCRFGWYEFVYYRDHGIFPINKEKLGRVLGPLKNEGNEMAQAVLTANGKVVPRRSIRHLRPDELNSDVEKSKRQAFDKSIHDKLGNSTTFPSTPTSSPSDVSIDGDIIEQEPSDTASSQADSADTFDQPMTDPLINSSVRLAQGDVLQTAKVLGHSINNDGSVTGTYNDNPILNTFMYDVGFPDGEVKEYSANIIAENMFAQVDGDGNTSPVFSGILSFTKDSSAVSKSDRFFITKTGRRHAKKTTDGFTFEVLYRDGTIEMVPLSKLKESNPIEVAEFAVSQNIQDEPAFDWWVPYTLRKRDRLIAAINARPKRVTHKYGCAIPATVEQAYAIDNKNGNSLWRDAITKEMENLKVAFDILPHGKKAPVGYTKSSGHLVFEVRMTLERKARWVKDGHRTKNPENSTYAGVVSRESVRIALLYAALNDLPVCACDIQNAYLQAPSSEKHFIICGPEFGLENVGKVAIIVRALYGGKSAGADYWRHVRQAMTSMKFHACPADPDVWMREGVKDNGTIYWQFVLLYTDDILAIMTYPQRYITNELGSYFTVKPNSIGPPTQYLGNKVSQVTLSNNVVCWSFSSSQYVQNAVSNVEKYLDERDLKLPNRCKSPWPSNYKPELDISPELSPTDAAYFQSLIGVLRWIVELGRGDICTEVSAMASMMALPRQGHLNTLFQMFSFLKGNHNGVMVFDPTYPAIDDSQFIDEDWSATPYGGSVEDFPPNMCEARGAGMIMRAFVDSDHASDTTNRRSRTDLLSFLIALQYSGSPRSKLVLKLVPLVLNLSR